LGSEGIASRILLTSSLDGGEWSASRPGRFTLRERDRGWVGPRAGLDAVVRKIPSPYWELNPPIMIIYFKITHLPSCTEFL